MGFRGVGQIDPPQRILAFKYPSRDRVKMVSDEEFYYEIDKTPAKQSSFQVEFNKHGN